MALAFALIIAKVWQYHFNKDKTLSCLYYLWKISFVQWKAAVSGDIPEPSRTCKQAHILSPGPGEQGESLER